MAFETLGAFAFENFKVSLNEGRSVLAREKTFVQSFRHLEDILFALFPGFVDERHDAPGDSIEWPMRALRASNNFVAQARDRLMDERGRSCGGSCRTRCVVRSRGSDGG